MRTLWLLLLLVSAVSSAQNVYQTSDIALLDNRFRVDYEVEQVTFIVARERFSKAVILVRPDGHEIYAWDTSDDVHWVEGEAHDIITLDNPMPGPWQALGKISGDNRIQLLSNVQLRVDRFPVQLYSGERLKLTGALYNDEQQLNQAYLEDVGLTLTAYGYNRPQDDNFDFTSRQLAAFNDRGQRFDEIPRDGVFSCDLTLALATGKYNFAVAVNNEVFSRRFNQDVVVFPNPVQLQMQALMADDSPPQLQFTVDSAELDPASVVVSGLLRSPQGDVVSRFILYGKAGNTEYQQTFSRPASPGGYKVEAELFATTRLGREIIISLPSQAFIIPLPLIIDTALVVTKAELQVQAKADAATKAAVQQQSNWLRWLLAIVVLTSLLAVVTLVAVKLYQKRKCVKELAVQPQVKAAQPAAVAPSTSAPAEIDLDLNSLADDN